MNATGLSLGSQQWLRHSDSLPAWQLKAHSSGAASANAAAEAAAFIRKHAPVQADAIAKWDAAFAEAALSGRRVWAQIGQRYCGPCFRLSRWLDDNCELLERNYVLLKSTTSVTSTEPSSPAAS